MSEIQAAALVTGLFVLLFMGLKSNVGLTRVKTKTDLGDGGNDKMLRAIRAQGNAIEDVPVLLIGIWALALLAVPANMILALGVFLLVARLLHAVGICQVKGLEFGRIAGTVMTGLSFLMIGTGLIYSVFA